MCYVLFHSSRVSVLDKGRTVATESINHILSSNATAAQKKAILTRLYMLASKITLTTRTQSTLPPWYTLERRRGIQSCLNIFTDPISIAIHSGSISIHVFGQVVH